jgi:hypothetical protein
MGVNIFHGYGFGIAKPSGFVPVAISSCDGVGWRPPLMEGGVGESLCGGLGEESALGPYTTNPKSR